MTAGRFDISRADGRSDSQVVLDYVRSGEPGHIYSYEELGAALQEGTTRTFTVQAVRSVVMVRSFGRLLKEQQRALRNVRGVGYLLAHASDHNAIAQDRQRRSAAQIRKALQILQHVRYDEMTENQRNAHLGQLMLVGALCANQQALEKRQRAAEDAIEKLSKRVDSMSPRQGPA